MYTWLKLKSAGTPRARRLVSAAAAVAVCLGVPATAGAAHIAKVRPRVPFTIPDEAKVYVDVARSANEGAVRVEVFDPETGRRAGVCEGFMTVCWGSTATGWVENGAPKRHRFYAKLVELWPGGGTEVSDPVGVRAKRRLFRVALTFANLGYDAAHGFTNWRATFTSDYSLNASPYSLRLRDETGATVASCTSPFGDGKTCQASVRSGKSYRASVEDSTGHIYGKSSYFTLTQSEAIEETVARMDLVTLAALYTGARDVCDRLLFYPGTHTAGSSLSDQYIACDAAATMGMSAREAIRRAALAAGAAAAGGVLVYLRSEVDTSDRIRPAAPPWPVPPPPPPGEPQRPFVPLLSQEWDSERLAAELQEQDPAMLDEDQPLADMLANQCLALSIRLARVATAGDPAKSAYEECADTGNPIFAPGSDMPETTTHDLEALDDRPEWLLLHYDAIGHSRTWLDDPVKAPECNPRASLHCDEFPFASTAEGGEGNAPSLKLVPAGESPIQGGWLSGFYNACLGYTDGRRFLVVPLPPDLGIPTQRLCRVRQ